LFFILFPLYICTLIETIQNDSPEPWGTFFQDNATPQMEGLEELHNKMFYLAIILFAVSWMMVSTILNFKNKKISNKYVNHGTLVNLILIISPALILIVFPPFKLLYLMDEVIDPALVIYGEGHQWYWSYKHTDYINKYIEIVEFDFQNYINYVKISELLNPVETRYDTDILADHLQDYKNNNPNKINLVRDANISLKSPQNRASHIARFVHRNNVGIFRIKEPGRTLLDDALITNIRNLRQNVR
jgi:heme/copper-type cytochrome/quinol oxidase subunit 2